MKATHVPQLQHFFLPLCLILIILLNPVKSLAGNPAPFSKKIRVTGNTLIDPYDLERYLDLGNGLNMTPEIMDLAVSELKANYSFHGYNFIDAYSTLKIKDGVMTIKVDENEEHQWGRPRAERAVLKQAFLHGIELKDFKKQKIINTLLKGYQKQKKVEELVSGFLVGKQRSGIEEIKSQRIAALREKVTPHVRDFQTIKKNMAEQETKRIAEMRARMEASLIKKYDDSTETRPLASEEYSDLDEFLDNSMFEEVLNPGQ